MRQLEWCRFVLSQIETGSEWVVLKKVSVFWFVVVVLWICDMNMMIYHATTTLVWFETTKGWFIHSFGLLLKLPPTPNYEGSH